MRSKIAWLLALAVISGAGCAVTASAQPNGRGPWDRSSWQRGAYDNGYHEGVIAGQRDARARQAYDYRRERAYRDADWGYDRRFGGRGQYRQAFRRGFEEGYRDGYQRRGAYDRGGVYDRRGPSRNVPYGGYGVPDRGHGYGTVGSERGFSDGYEKGREDARDGDRHDPRRHKWYREGDRGYRRDYGSRDYYKRLYRDAFLQGYERGYRESAGGYGVYRRY
jgi:hypothetical protein